MLGGNGYVEESILPRLYREAPVNSIWEGSGNVMCLDVLRAIARTPKAAEVLRHELADAGDRAAEGLCRSAAAALARADATTNRRRARSRAIWCWRCRRRCSSRHAPPAVADAFCASRLAGEGGGAFGTLPRGLDCGVRAGARFLAAHDLSENRPRRFGTC